MGQELLKKKCVVFLASDESILTDISVFSTANVLYYMTAVHVNCPPVLHLPE